MVSVFPEPLLYKDLGPCVQRLWYYQNGPDRPGHHQAVVRLLHHGASHGLSRTTGGAHFTLSEAQLVEHMKGLAVRYQNPAVHVQEFLGLSQQHDEGVRHYLSRLKGVASRCSFEIQCSCGITNSFTEAITRFKLIAGLADTDIKQDILSKSDMSLEETVKAVEGKESGKEGG